MSSDRAAVLDAPGALHVRAHDVRPSAGDAVVRILASGVCGTDVDIYRGVVTVERGRVLGHEGAGVVETAPPGSTLEQGTAVVVDPTIACGACAVCREGLPNLCVNGGLLGREIDGVFADLVALSPRNVFPLPAEVDVRDAPLLQVLATVVHAQERVHVTPGRPAAVVGLGCTGQLHAQVLAKRGARVLGVTRSAEKRRLAAELSCEWTASPDDAPAAAGELGPLGGADLVVECAGTVETLNLAARLARPGGVVLAYGVQAHADAQLDSYLLYKKELDLIRSRANHPRDLEVAVGLAASGAVRLAPLVSERLPLEQIGDALEHSAAGSLKVVLEHA